MPILTTNQQQSLAYQKTFLDTFNASMNNNANTGLLNNNNSAKSNIDINIKAKSNLDKNLTSSNNNDDFCKNDLVTNIEEFL